MTGETGVQAAGRAFTAEAERCVGRALDLVLASMERRHGPAPGACAVLAMGKLGGRELSMGSDLDVILVFQRRDDAYCHYTAAYFEEVARGLVGALSHTEIGTLYDVDMRLRPHGADGVLAVELSALADYYLEACWTWELMALTRGRVVAGDPGVARAAMAVRRQAIDHAIGLTAAQTLADVADMRQLLEEERPAATPWDVKRATGGLIDIEFIVQGLQLAQARRLPGLASPSTPAALERLSAWGLIDPKDARRLIGAWSLQALVQQHQRALGVDPAALAAQPARRLAGLLSNAGVTTIAALNRALMAAQQVGQSMFHKLVAMPSLSRLAA